MVGATAGLAPHDSFQATDARPSPPSSNFASGASVNWPDIEHHPSPLSHWLPPELPGWGVLMFRSHLSQVYFKNSLGPLHISIPFSTSCVPTPACSSDCSASTQHCASLRLPSVCTCVTAMHAHTLKVPPPANPILCPLMRHSE
jgi:hypothetical protein